MVFSDSGKISSPFWYINEKFMSEDIKQMTLFEYSNMANIMAIASLGCYGAIRPLDAEIPSICLGGLGFKHYTSMTFILHAGSVTSFKGSYIYNEEWQWHSADGESFFVTVPKTQSLTFSDGGASDRIDIVEIRPVMAPYEVEAREFYGAGVENQEVLTEFSYEFQIVEGVGGSGVAPASTAGWVKIAEVYVPASATSITEDNLLEISDSDLWTTETSTVRCFNNILEKDSEDTLNIKNFRSKLNSLIFTYNTDTDGVFDFQPSGSEGGYVEMIAFDRKNWERAYMVANSTHNVVVASRSWIVAHCTAFPLVVESNEYTGLSYEYQFICGIDSRDHLGDFIWYAVLRDSTTFLMTRLATQTGSDTGQVINTFANNVYLGDAIYDDIHKRFVVVGGYVDAQYKLISCVTYLDTGLTGYSVNEQTPDSPYNTSYAYFTGVTVSPVDNKLWACATCEYSNNIILIHSSPDGITWTQEAVLSGSSDMISHKILWSELFNKFFMTADVGGVLTIYESVDGVTWTESYSAGLSTGVLYMPSRIKENSYYNTLCVLIGTSVHGMAFLFTTDGVTWRRTDDIVKVPNNTKDASTPSIITHNFPVMKDLGFSNNNGLYIVGGVNNGASFTIPTVLGG